ncbi:hypothetical protein B0T25DRAFT_536398 [Lasiosphaeria hispida]|uniref:Uncharacterized protein n=1 Tax=Lasiosphaeria hispida TaxID=260671 RepID=A0AAJ0HTA8_9PEZI|nr:hypothetical protein B0T25DRAFT_536398 [Lasiosphaeria hispida]
MCGWLDCHMWLDCVLWVGVGVGEWGISPLSFIQFHFSHFSLSLLPSSLLFLLPHLFPTLPLLPSIPLLTPSSSSLFFHLICLYYPPFAFWAWFWFW